MTWQKSFFKLTLHDIKKRSWCMAIFFVAQFFALPVTALLASQGYSGYEGINRNLAAQYLNELAQLFERNIFDIGSKTSPILLIVGAIIMAMSGFSYLNSKRKVDFIHSMPVKRETLFLSRYTAGFFLYVLPMVVNVGIGLIISVTLKVCSVYVLRSALYFLLYQMIYFLLFYSTAILAIVLIGNFVVSFLGIGILFSYQTIFWFVLVNLKENFFQTYMRSYQEFHVYDPIGLFIRQVMSLNQNYLTYSNEALVRVGEEGYYSTGGEVCLIALFIAVMTGVLALVLFRFRKSETAGKTLAFPKLEPFAKAALLLPAGLIGGLVMYGIASGYRRVWYIFGAVAVFLLGAAAVEIIFRQDFKSLLKHKLSAAAGGGLILLITLCFWLDLLGYDNRIPKAGQIESIGISIPDVEYQRNFYVENLGNYDHAYSVRYFSDQYIGTEEAQNVNPILYYCKITNGEEIEKVRALAGYFAEHKGKSENENLECQVVYRLKNGKSVYRSYRMPYGEEFLKVAEPVFASADYRKASELIFQDENNYRYLNIHGVFTGKSKMISQNDKKELLECYRKDREKLTFQTVWEQNVSGYFSMMDTLGSKNSVACHVYESDTNTRKWLEERGIGFQVQPGEIEVISGKILYQARDGRYAELNLSNQENEDIIPYLTVNELIAPGAQVDVESEITVMLEYNIKQEDDQVINERNYFHDNSGDVYTMEEIFFLKEIPPFIQDKLS